MAWEIRDRVDLEARRKIGEGRFGCKCIVLVGHPGGNPATQMVALNREAPGMEAV